MRLCRTTLAVVVFAAARPAAAQESPDAPVDFIPVPDRWRIPFGDWHRYPDEGRYVEGTEEYPFSPGFTLNPYRQNTLKGDYPIFPALLGQEWFLALTVTSDTIVEERRLPTPSGVSTSDPNADGFFGRGRQLFANENLLLSFELFKGDAGYRPRDLELRLTPVFSRNYLRLEENNGTAIDPREGEIRNDRWLALQEAFLEYHIADTSPFYDFVSIRAGVQGFTSDFRGFVFSDNEPGIRLFGSADSTRFNWNVAWFDFAEKDTNSGLVKVDDLRQQQLTVVNGFLQDCFALGWTHELSVVWNRDHAGKFVDDNGFPNRPTRIGTIETHDVDTLYLGWTSDGHAGPINISHALYEVVGKDDGNPLAGRSQKVNAQMAALELSRDFDWLRPKVSLFFASGDASPTDGRATGFDSVFDNTNFVGGAFSFWNRQGIPLTGTAVTLVNRLSLLPDLRTSKTHDQANYVNPGILIANAGLEAKLTQELKLDLNANWMRFARTDALELALNDDQIRPEIGWDLSAGITARPWLTDNVIVGAGIAWLIPEGGFRDIYGGQSLLSAFLAITVTW